jgi:hypothetical protein
VEETREEDAAPAVAQVGEMVGTLVEVVVVAAPALYVSDAISLDTTQAVAPAVNNQLAYRICFLSR